MPSSRIRRIQPVIVHCVHESPLDSNRLRGGPAAATRPEGHYRGLARCENGPTWIKGIHRGTLEHDRPLNYRRFASIGTYDVDNIYTFIFLRLRSVLGQRTGAERPPYDRRDVLQGNARGDNNKVMPLPGSVIEPAP